MWLPRIESDSSKTILKVHSQLERSLSKCKYESLWARFTSPEWALGSVQEKLPFHKRIRQRFGPHHLPHSPQPPSPCKASNVSQSHLGIQAETADDKHPMWFPWEKRCNREMRWRWYFKNTRRKAPGQTWARVQQPVTESSRKVGPLDFLDKN